MSKKSKAPTHLSDLFRIGEIVVVEDSEGNTFRIFVRRPSPLQQEQSREKANGRAGRYKREILDATSDAYIALRAGLDEMNREDLMENRAIFDSAEIRDIAFNEVMYDESIGEDWNKDDRYLVALSGLYSRMEEIKKYNEEMEEAGADDRIDEETDEQYQTADKEYKLFQKEVDDRFDVLLQEKVAERGDTTDEELKLDIIKVSTDLESKMRWYESYQINMLYYACRYPDDKRKMYFGEPGEVLELPEYIRKQLFSAYERLEAGSDDVKNSLSLPNSSA